MLYLEKLVQAIVEHKMVYMTYRSATGEETERTVVPYLVVRDKQGRVYVWAYCKLRKGARTFRVDRIQNIAMKTDARVSARVYYEGAKGTKLENIGLVSGDVLAIVQ